MGLKYKKGAAGIQRSDVGRKILRDPLTSALYDLSTVGYSGDIRSYLTSCVRSLKGSTKTLSLFFLQNGSSDSRLQNVLKIRVADGRSGVLVLEPEDDIPFSTERGGRLFRSFARGAKQLSVHEQILVSLSTRKYLLLHETPSGPVLFTYNTAFGDTRCNVYDCDRVTEDEPGGPMIVLPLILRGGDGQSKRVGVLTIESDIGPGLRYDEQHDGRLLESSGRVATYLSAVSRNLVQVLDFSKDPLTGLYLRRFFLDELGGAIATTKKARPIYLFMFDVDHFKDVNDAFGHGAGDRVLSTIPLVTTLRSIDVLARWGGEEFIGFLAPDTSREDGRRKDLPLTMRGALEVIARVKDAIFRHNFPDVGRISCSFGLVSSLQARRNPEEMLRLADALLYISKLAGRNRISYHSGRTVRAEAIERLTSLTADGRSFDEVRGSLEGVKVVKNLRKSS